MGKRLQRSFRFIRRDSKTMTFVFIYNILLIILYTVTFSLTLNCYLKDKSKLFLSLSAYLSFYIVDNVIIYMTEFLNSFAAQYNKSFMNVPIIKTVIFMGNAITALACILLLAHKKISTIDYLCLFLLLIWMLFIPLMPNSALEVWLYYLPNQLFLLYLGLRALYFAKRPQQTVSKTATKYLYWVAVLAIIFSVLIVIEDSYVIFNVDQYSSLTLKIYNRNISEDIFSILMSSLILYALIFDKKVSSHKEKIKEVDSACFPLFCEAYQFTPREVEIVKLLLEQKQNQDIADELYLSVGTVKTHIHNIFVKTGIQKRQQIETVYEEFKNECGED